MLVRVETRTSSPCRMPRAARARCSAVVPLEVDTPNSLSEYRANSSSNLAMYSPKKPEIAPLLNASLTHSDSAAPREGCATGMRRFMSVPWEGDAFTHGTPGASRAEKYRFRIPCHRVDPS